MEPFIENAKAIFKAEIIFEKRYALQIDLIRTTIYTRQIYNKM